jgi:hypothetical protein
MDKQQRVNRWRLILGDFAEQSLPLHPSNADLDNVLYFLYNREYGSEQGMREENASKGGRGGSMLTVPGWLKQVKTLFPQKTVEIMQKQALDKYNLTQLLTDESVLKQLEPNLNLLRNILSFRNLMPDHVKKLAYSIVEQVIRDLQKKLEIQVKRTFYGRKLPMSNSSYKIFRNFDFKQTIRKNLKNYSPTYGIVPERLYFNQNVRRYNPWHVIILVDESGSMLDSVIYSAVMASIFARMPFLSVKLVIFDTSVVDLSDYIDDPVATLMKVQLGGGTDIHGALEYGKKLVVAPQKTIFVLVSDLYDGNNYNLMYRSCRDIIEAGSRLFVLPALDYSSTPCYDKRAAKSISLMGADVAAITPEKLAEWIGKIIS